MPLRLEEDMTCHYGGCTKLGNIRVLLKCEDDPYFEMTKRVCYEHFGIELRYERCCYVSSHRPLCLIS